MAWKLDTIMLMHFNEKALPKWHGVFEVTAHVGFLFVVLYLLPIFYLYFSDPIHNFIPIIQMTIVAVTAIILGYIMKAVILRPRPHNHVTYLGKSDSAFPSSHTSVAFGLAALLHMYLWQLSPLWWLLASLVGLGRIYIQMHYLSDVIGGIIIGLLLAFLTLLYFQPYYVQFLIG